MKPVLLLAMLLLSLDATAAERRTMATRAATTHAPPPAKVPQQQQQQVRPVNRGVVVRTAVQTSPGFPVRRQPVSAYRPWPARPFRVVPTVFLPVVVFAPVVVEAAGGPLWQEGVDLQQPYDWTEADFELPASGGELLLSIDARAEIDFVELTFTDGSTQVVDFGREVRQPGTYELAQVDSMRPIDHLRVVARSTDAAAGLTLQLTQ